MRCLLDTSAYSALRRGHEPITAHIERAEWVFLTPVVTGELRSGFLGGSQLDDNDRLLWQFLDEERVGLLSIVEETGRRYSLIRHYLAAQGTPIPVNDIWIAASAFEHGLNLVTTDRHFERIPQVALDWFET